MDEMPSAQFRRRYASLQKPTVVTVNGHPIGQWLPATYPITVTIEQTEGTVTIDPPPMQGQIVTFNARGSRPAPKPGK